MESITVEDLITTTTPVVDVRSHGVVGDGETDDSPGFQAAADHASPHGVLYIPSDCRVRLGSPVEIDLSAAEHNRFSVICHGAISPDPGIGDAITITDGNYPYVFVCVEGGGADVESDTAVAVEGGGAGFFEGYATGYDGTVYEVRNAATYSIGTLRTSNCGQSLGVYDASPMGEFRDGFDVRPVRSPEFHNTSDICINQYENFVSTNCERGLVFDNCLSIWADKVAIGGTAEVPIFEIRDSRHAFFNALHLGGAPDLGGRIDNTTFSTFQIFCNINEVGVEYTGSLSTGNRILLNARGIEDTALRITDDIAGGYHYVTGNIVDNAASGIDIRTANADIHLDNLNCVGNRPDLALPNRQNEVHITNSRIRSIHGEPKRVNVVGHERADAESPDGVRWDVGTIVMFTDTEDGSGDGIYLRIDDDSWMRVQGELVEADRIGLVLAQSNWTGHPGPLEPGQTFGQTFGLDRDIASIEIRTADCSNESGATMTLFEGSPDDGDLSRVASKRLEPVWDRQWVRWDIDPASTGPFYLELSDPRGTPTWWWQSGGDDLADLGGTAFVDREPQPETNFTIRAFG